jgi:hypothetical protein
MPPVSLERDVDHHRKMIGHCQYDARMKPRDLFSK